MLQFGVESDPPPRLGLLGAHQLHDVGQRCHLIQSVEARIGGAQRGDALLYAQSAQFGEGEVLGKPARHQPAIDGLVAAAILEFLAGGDIGGGRQLVFVARDQHQIPGRDQIGLDVVRALIDRAFIGGEGVFWPLGARAAVGDDQHVLRGQRCGRCRKRQTGDQSKAADHSSSLKPTRRPCGCSAIGRLMMLGC